MKLKIGGPNNFNKVITVDKEDSFDKLLAIAAPPLIVSGVRFGYPPQTIEITQETLNESIDALGISSGEKIILVGSESEVAKLPIKARPAESQNEPTPTETAIVLPNGAQEILRVHKVPDDNSCLFHAISYCNYKDITISHQLRSIVAHKIRSDPIEYSEAVLDKPNEAYAQWILKKDSWGGGIEIAILSEKLNIAVFVLDMDAQQFEKFNEDRFKQFIIILFNGIHYDSVELSDGQTVFNKGDEFLSQVILSGSLQIAKQMKKHGYSFNTQRAMIICKTCNAKLVGERDVARHAESTGHIDFGQTKT